MPQKKGKKSSRRGPRKDHGNFEQWVTSSPDALLWKKLCEYKKESAMSRRSLRQLDVCISPNSNKSSLICTISHYFSNPRKLKIVTKLLFYGRPFLRCRIKAIWVLGFVSWMDLRMWLKRNFVIWRDLWKLLLSAVGKNLEILTLWMIQSICNKKKFYKNR